MIQYTHCIVYVKSTSVAVSFGKLQWLQSGVCTADLIRGYGHPIESL